MKCIQIDSHNFPSFYSQNPITLAESNESFSSGAGKTTFPFAAGQIFALNLAKWQRLFCYYIFFLFCRFYLLSIAFFTHFLPLFFCAPRHLIFSFSISSSFFFGQSVCVGGIFFSCTTISLFALCFRGELILHFRSFNCISTAFHWLPWAGLKVPWSCFGRRKFICRTGNRSESHMNFPTTAGYELPLGSSKKISTLNDRNSQKSIQKYIYFTRRNGTSGPKTKNSGQPG